MTQHERDDREPAHLLVDLAHQMLADVAVLLALDETSRLLEVVHSHGVGLAAYEAVRIPIGEGFAGTIAATRSSAVIRDLSRELPSADLVLLRRLGVRSLLGVPLRAGGVVAGVLLVAAFRPDAFDRADASRLQPLADRVDRVSTQRRSDQQHSAALVLQRSLLPPAPPPIAGLDLAARYLPADGHLGGDWFDVFLLPGDRVGFVMGDVAGHGLHSAVVMGRLRSALRAYALDHDDPADVLTHLHRKIIHFEPGVFATVLCGFATAALDSITFSSAGHLPPAMATPQHPTVMLDIPPDPPLCAGINPHRRTTTVAFHPGDSLCLYTDGLVEQRDDTRVPDQHSRGLRLLRNVFHAGPAGTAAMALIDALVDRPTAHDDITLLIAHRTR